jgi:CubicO group peptidase (beta-lactamase class C family)
MAEISYRRHHFPPVIIQHAVWLYLRFTLNYRDVEELLAERGLDISYESVLTWAGIFNTYYWLDPQKHVAGVILTQILPFADHKSRQALWRVRERGLRCAEGGLTSDVLPYVDAG